MKRESISVCMASYNGARYIEKQIESILNQLSFGDELIIVDDCSTDDTVEIIKSLKCDYVRLFENHINMGYVKAFERALSLSKNDYICLTDQDDTWIEGRMNKLYKTMKDKNILLVASNFQIDDPSHNKISFCKLKSENSRNYFGNIIRIFLGKSAYYGCSMMINKKLLKYILPFPTYIEAHDLWIAMTANILKSVYHVSDNTLIYRIHENNTSLRKRSLVKKIRSRYLFFKTIISILKKI